MRAGSAAIGLPGGGYLPQYEREHLAAMRRQQRLVRPGVADPGIGHVVVRDGGEAEQGAPEGVEDGAVFVGVLAVGDQEEVDMRRRGPRRRGSGAG